MLGSKKLVGPTALGERQMRLYQQRIYTSPHSGEVGRGSGRVGSVEARQIVTRSRESTLPGPESPTLPQAGGCFQLEVYSHLPLALLGNMRAGARASS